MSRVAVNKVSAGTQEPPSIFQEIAKRFDAVRRRAFDLFEKRGRGEGKDLDDWVQAEHELLGWSPSKLVQRNGGYDVEIALPGFDATGIEVTATADEIAVHAAAQTKEESESRGVVWTEFGSNEVYRRFDLPNPINLDAVTAKLEKGILHIKAPVAAETKAAAAVAN